MLRDKLNEALKDAMRARDTEALGAVRLIPGQAQGSRYREPHRGEPRRRCRRQDSFHAPRHDQAAQRIDHPLQKGNRPELAAKEKAEIAVIERFLPKQMDDAAVDAAVKEAIASAGATSVKDMGGVMAALKTKFAGQMDFAKASAAVKMALTG